MLLLPFNGDLKERSDDGDAEELMAKLDAARQRVAKDTDHRRHGEIDRRGAFR